jgi:hypothetical protein
MVSDKIDEWVKKDPESWSKLAEKTRKKESFASFKKKFLKGAKKQGKYNEKKKHTNQKKYKLKEEKKHTRE